MPSSRAPVAPAPRRFAAIDFETADGGRDSACAVAVVVVEGSRIVQRRSALVRPPRRRFEFTHIHGIRWTDVADAPSFGEVWSDLAPELEGVHFLAAHNAPFDRSVLHAGCVSHRLAPPALDFLCTVRLARRTWGVYPTTLPDVCRHLGIGLRHHDALSDAEACARIVVAARQSGAPV